MQKKAAASYFSRRHIRISCGGDRKTHTTAGLNAHFRFAIL